MLPADPTPAAAEPAGEVEDAEDLNPGAVALRARDRAGHRRPVPLHAVRGTHTDRRGESPLRSIPSPTALVQTPHAGGRRSPSSLMPATVRPGTASVTPPYPLRTGDVYRPYARSGSGDVSGTVHGSASSAGCAGRRTGTGALR